MARRLWNTLWGGEPTEAVGGVFVCVSLGGEVAVKSCKSRAEIWICHPGLWIYGGLLLVHFHRKPLQ